MRAIAVVSGAPPLAELKDRSGLLALYRWLLFFYPRHRELLRFSFHAVRPFLSLKVPMRFRPLLLKLLQPCDANVMRDIAAFEACFESQRQAWRASADGLMVDARNLRAAVGFSARGNRGAGSALARKKGPQLSLATRPVVRRAAPPLRRASGGRGRALFAAHPATCARSWPTCDLPNVASFSLFVGAEIAQLVAWKILQARCQDQPVRRTSNIGPEFEERVRQLVADWGAEKSPELIEELIVTALKMARDKMGTGDLKLMNRSLKELRYAAKVFAPYRDVRKVSSSARPGRRRPNPRRKLAEEFGRQMVAHNYMVITGGGDGIMGAAQRGAGRENSFGLNIRLPFEQRANEIIHGDPKLINFNYFFTRKLNFVKETHAYALFPGGFGTMDEGFEALTLMQTGKALIIPIVLLDRPDGSYWETWMRFLTDHLLKHGLISKEDFNFIKIAHNVTEAVDANSALLPELQLFAVGRIAVGIKNLQTIDEQSH